MTIARRPTGIALVRRGASAGMLACLLAGAIACSVEVLPDTDTAAATTSAAGEVIPASRAAGDDAVAALDTVPFAPDPTPHPAPGAPRDTTPVVASPGELAELSAAMTVPVQGVAASELRDSFDEARGAGSRVHQALDIHAPRGTPVVAATDGRVLKLHESRPGGLMIYQADATDRFVLMYGHLERYAPGLADGVAVQRGQVIGYVGTSGNAAPDAPHLHFVVARGRPSASWWRGTPVNPYPLLLR